MFCASGKTWSGDSSSGSRCESSSRAKKASTRKDAQNCSRSGVPRGARQRLASGGWALHDVAAASRPSDTHISNSRLRFAYSKLELWRLPYDVVVYADADAIALGPVDALFGCRASLCARLRPRRPLVG